MLFKFRQFHWVLICLIIYDLNYLFPLLAIFIVFPIALRVIIFASSHDTSLSPDRSLLKKFRFRFQLRVFMHCRAMQQFWTRNLHGLSGEHHSSWWLNWLLLLDCLGIRIPIVTFNDELVTTFNRIFSLIQRSSRLQQFFAGTGYRLSWYLRSSKLLVNLIQAFLWRFSQNSCGQVICGCCATIHSLR